MANLQAAVAEAVSGTMEERGRGFASDREAWAELKECIERTSTALFAHLTAPGAIKPVSAPNKSRSHLFVIRAVAGAVDSVPAYFHHQASIARSGLSSLMPCMRAPILRASSRLISCGSTSARIAKIRCF